MNWSAVPKNYDIARTMAAMRQVRCRDHPLIGLKGNDAEAAPTEAEVSKEAEAPKKQIVDDPLSAALDDPLSAALSDPAAPPGELSIAEQQKMGLEEESAEDGWEEKRQQILREYTAGAIKVKASFLDDSRAISSEEGSTADKSKSRLEQLVGSEKGLLELSQKEYMDHIQKLHKELVRAWNTAEKVLSLKLAIQCAKLLADTDVPHFYPSCFVLVTQILDTFGNLVYDRIKAKAEEGGPGFPKVKLNDNWLSTDIRPEAKETCRNWFYKTACIRELLPRLYMEIALLKCFRFLADGEYPQILARLSHMIRGIGDPMIAVYTRTYLARGMSKVLPDFKEPVMNSFSDYLFTFREFQETKITTYLSQQGMGRPDYLRLHSPAVQWLLKVLGRNAGKEQFTTVLQHYRGYCNNSMVLCHVIDAFDAKLYAPNAVAMVALIKESGESKITHTEVFTVCARKFVEHPPPPEQRLPLLNEVWKTVTREEDLAVFCECVAAFTELLLKHYSDREVMIILKDCVRHLSAGDPQREDVLKPLERTVRAIVDHATDLGGVLTTDAFQTIMGVFKAERKADICKSLLDQFGRNQRATSDIIIINTLFDFARSLHDSVDSLSADGEKKHIATLICTFIEKIDFGQDLEQQLNVYVDCRAAFANLDAVMDRLVLGVAMLAMRAFKFMKGRHTKKTLSFVKACLAYMHITIPSIDDAFRKLHLMLLCGQVPEQEQLDHRTVSTEAALVAYVKCFASALVIVPGHPEHGPFYLVRGLLNAIQRYPWKPETGKKIEVYVSLLGLLGAYSQAKLPYNIERVGSNDTLYGGNDDYINELNTYMTRVIDDILGQLTELGNVDKGKQALKVLDLVNQIVAVMAMNDGAVQMTAKLVDLAYKLKGNLSDQSYYNNTVAWIRMKSVESSKGLTDAGSSEGYQKLAQLIVAL